MKSNKKPSVPSYLLTARTNPPATEPTHIPAAMNVYDIRTGELLGSISTKRLPKGE